MSLTLPSRDSERGVTISSWSITAPYIRTFFTVPNAQTTLAWPTANQAYAIPFQIANPTTIVEVYTVAGTSPGTTNYDIGIYNDSFTLLRSLGSTASVNTTAAILPVGGGALSTPLVLQRGRYFLAMSAAAITFTNQAQNINNQFCRAFGIYTMATAFPLPATFVPAAHTGVNFLPTIYASTLTNVL